MQKNKIPGIHNYCDRWCERCHFTSRCAVFEEVSEVSPEEQDIKNKAFWDRLAMNFQNAITLLQKAAKEHGIDLDDVSPEEEQRFEEMEKERWGFAKQHPIGQLSNRYWKEADQWFKKRNAVKDIGNELVRHFEMGINNESETRDNLTELKDALDIIRWYMFFIETKLMRALMGKFDEDSWEEENGFQKDSNGSAKIALMALDRSMQAWMLLYRLLPQEEDSILELLATLQKIKRITEKEFPEAWKFIRPGFDE
jgi:hypothetical protein